MRRAWLVLASFLCAACGASGGAADVAADAEVASPAMARENVPPTARSGGPTVSGLVEFRDAAAAAPFWATVDWTPPTTVSEVVRRRDDAIATLVAAEVPADPRPDDLVPYEGAPTLHHLEVDLKVVDEEGRHRVVSVPVLSSGAEGLAAGDDAAALIVARAPIGARMLVVSGAGHASLVALEAADGSLVGYVSSLDDLVSPYTLTSLRTVVADALDEGPA